MPDKLRERLLERYHRMARSMGGIDAEATLARRLRISNTTLARCAAGLNVFPATSALVAQGLDELDREDAARRAGPVAETAAAR